MVGELKIEWSKKLLAAGWSLPPGTTSRLAASLLLNKYKLWRLPRNLWDPAIVDRFNQLIEGTPFLAWWREYNGGNGTGRIDNHFLLDFPENIWNIPWELLVGSLEDYNNQARIIFSRIAGKELLKTPCVIDGKLRILVLKGAPSVEDLDVLNLDQDVATIKKIWEDHLVKGVKDRVEEPYCIEATLDALTASLSTYKPHILWFTGHGEIKPVVRLLFADRSWVDGASLSKAIIAAEQKPIYAIFSACETTQAERKTSFSGCPSLFNELSKVGVVSILGMQSPISEPSAIVITRLLLEYLAAGHPMEKALARARAYVKHHPSVNSHPLDWASPVVWTLSQPVESIQWGQENAKIVQSQLLGRNALGVSQGQPQILDSPIMQENREKAEFWIANNRTWISGSSGNSYDKMQWVRTLQAVQNSTEYTVLAIELIDAENPEESMKEWARDVFNRIFYDDFSSPEILGRIKKLSDVTVAGWADLLKQPDIMISVSNPPRRQTEWFWEPISKNPNAKVVLLTQQIPPTDPDENWQIDRFADMTAKEEIIKGYESMPRLARAIAVLDFPLHPKCLSLSSETDSSTLSYYDWEGKEALFIDTEAGPVLTTTAKNIIRQRIEPQSQALQAHLDCLKLLDHEALQMTTAIKEKRIFHLVQASFKEAAAREANDLLTAYRSQDQPFRVIKLLELLSDNINFISSNSKCIAAWAYLKLGKIPHAKYWLERLSPISNLENAEKHGLMAGIFKSEGTEGAKQKAREEIVLAIEYCEKEQKNNPKNTAALMMSRAYRQDKARIDVFFFHELEKAAQEYELLNREWEEEGSQTIDHAIIKRNYSECLRLQSAEQRGAKWNQARKLIQDAYLITKKFPHSPASSEILYEYAKFMEKDMQLNIAQSMLAECIERAENTYHYMMLAIAQNRYFWKYKPFSNREWSEIISALEVYSNHGWAIRTIINSRLSASKIVEKTDGAAAALEILTKNPDYIINNPSFSTGSDRNRITRTYAGLHILTIESGHPSLYWDEYRKNYAWAEEWLRNKNMDNPNAVWEEV